MRREAKKYLFDIQQACGRITRYTAGKSFADYEADDLLQSGVERQLEIIGEALSQLYKIDVQTAERIPEFRRIIAFRNILIHGYASIQNETVWGVIEADLPKLAALIARLLADE